MGSYGQRINLVVEDEEKIIRLLELELGYEGYELGKACDGVSALQAYQEGEI